VKASFVFYLSEIQTKRWAANEQRNFTYISRDIAVGGERAATSQELRKFTGQDSEMSSNLGEKPPHKLWILREESSQFVLATQSSFGVTNYRMHH
jgi:hypothetical protein